MADPPDSMGVERKISSMILSSPCRRKRGKKIRECIAQNVHWFDRTPYECCVLKTLGFQIDYLRRIEADKLWMYRQFPLIKKNREMSQRIFIRGIERVAVLHFNSKDLFTSYVVSGTCRFVGDSGVVFDLRQFFAFARHKYGKPYFREKRFLPPGKPGETVDYAVWKRWDCTIKVSMVCDGNLVWAQESVVDNRYR